MVKFSISTHLSNPFQIDESISNIRVVVYNFIFLKYIQQANVPETDLVFHCLPMSHKMDAMLIWVNNIKFEIKMQNQI